MVPSDMDDGDPFLDVINENDLFGHDNDTGPSSFSWADEFLSTAEGEEESSAPSQLVQNHENISPTEVAPPSLEAHHQLSTQQNAVSSQAFMATGPTIQNQGSLSLGGVQMVQTTGLVQQAQVQNPVPAVQQPIAMSSLGQLQQGTGNQIVQGPNGQLILKTANGGQILLQTQTHLQTLQQASSPVPQLQQYQTNPQIINRILAPSQSPQTANASHATASSPHVSRSLTPVQSFAGMGPVTMVTSKGQGQIMTAAPNVNVLQLSSNNNTQQQVLSRNLPIQLPNTNTGINLQGQSTVLQTTQGQGSIIQHGQNPGALLQQGQGQAVLSGQGQNIVNTQNTVIQNPNVVNLNVAHVLCNNSQLQNQSSSTVHHMAPNIQGTLIQTADGKHIIIPNHQMTQGQSINIQNLPQMTIQPQLNLAQPNNSTGSNVIGNASTVLQGNLALGNIGNVLRMTNSGTTQPETKPQNQQINNPTHFIGVNQQGQQILIQRTPTPTGQQQNIILRAVNPSNLVLPQQQTSGVTGSSPQLQTNQTVTTQPIMMTSQGQQNVQLQRIVTNNQGQQVKLVSQQTPNMPLTINLAGSNLSNIQSGVQTIQVLPQQAKQVNSSGLVGSDAASQGVISTLPGSSQSQVGMIITSQAFNNNQNSSTKTAVRNSQSNQQLHTQITMAPNSSQAVQLSQVPQQQTTKLVANSNIQQMDTQTGNNPQQLVQTLQNIHIPISSSFQTSNSVPNLSTANTTPVTTTITQSNVQQTYVTSLSSTPISQVVSSVTFQQSVPVSQKQQHILQARDSAPKLQHTIQISAEAQQQLARIQTEMKQLSSQKVLNTNQKNQLTKLMDLQKRILSQGQLQVRQVQNLQTTSVPSPLTQHLLNQQNSQQQLSVQTSQTNQDVKPMATLSPQLLSNQQTSRVLGQLKTENISSPLSVKDQNLTNVSSGVSSQIQQTSFLQSSLASTAVKGKLVIKAEPSSTLSCNFSSSQTSSEPITSFSQTTFASQIKMENSMTKTMPQPISNLQESSQVPSTVPKNPSAMVHHVAPPPPPGKVAIPASPQVAVLTQIKIGNHTLSLSLTPQQKEKVLGYLSKMTPEMQQQQISMLLKLQQQQQLQLQVQQQVQAQQNLQQQKQQQQTSIVNSIAAQKSTKIPLTVQQLDSAKVKSNEQAAILNQTVTISPALKPVSFATLSSTQLIHQQMSKDQDNAVQPDTKTPFKSRRDTYRRLLRYHVYQARLPPQTVMDKDENLFHGVSEVLLQKKDKMFEKFRVLLLQESMREKKTAEMLMIQRLLNEDLTETVKTEKEIAKTDPDMFEPMPMRYLKKEDKAEQSSNLDSVIVKHEKMDFDPSRVKQEDMTMTPTRPSTPKVKLVIRNNGQNFTSTLAESNSDSNDGDYHDSEEDMEVKSEGALKQESNIRLVNDSLLNVKNEPDEEENSPWNSNADKPFENFMADDIPPDNVLDCESSPIVNDTGQDYNSISSDGGEEDNLQLSSATMNEEEERQSYSPSFETSDVLRNLTTSNHHSQDFQSEFHSKDQQQRLNDSFVNQNIFGSQGDTKSDLDMVIDDSSSDKQLYSSQNLFSDDEKVPFSQNELFSQSMENTVTRQDSISSHTARTVSSVSNFPQSGHAPLAQYEPISSPEIDHDDTFSNMITHRVDSSYTIGVGDQKSSTQLSAPDFSTSSFPSQPLSVKSSMDASDEETTLYSDSDKEPDPQDALLKAQMESAINSIVSLNQDSSPYSLDPDNKAPSFFTHHNFEDSQTSQSEDSQPTSPAASITEEKDGDVSMDDDLDAAVQSILM